MLYFVNMTGMASAAFVEDDDDLPLPSFTEMFGDGFSSSNKGKKKKSGKTDEEVTGRWTPNEHRIFLEGIMLYGRDWKKVQALLKTRNVIQIRTHAQKVFKKCSLNRKAAGGVGGFSMNASGPMNAMEKDHIQRELNAANGAMGLAPGSMIIGTDMLANSSGNSDSNSNNSMINNNGNNSDMMHVNDVSGVQSTMTSTTIVLGLENAHASLGFDKDSQHQFQQHSSAATATVTGGGGGDIHSGGHHHPNRNLNHSMIHHGQQYNENHANVDSDRVDVDGSNVSANGHREHQQQQYMHQQQSMMNTGSDDGADTTHASNIMYYQHQNQDQHQHQDQDQGQLQEHSSLHPMYDNADPSSVATGSEPRGTTSHLSDRGGRDDGDGDRTQQHDQLQQHQQQEVDEVYQQQQQHHEHEQQMQEDSNYQQFIYQQMLQQQ